jgi:periplasmic divalent cation tolerance protein
VTTIAVLTTIDTLDQARVIAKELVEHNLAACAQISTIESFYTWDGTTQCATEFRVLIKTVAERYQAVEEAIRELHSYDLPAIYAFNMAHIFEPYSEWIAENSSGDNS